ncbi:MAG: chromate transporter [Kiritimatiellaeota bacterium]|nr:chromate transporter [Kiritimatiellota bacterium]
MMLIGGGYLAVPLFINRFVEKYRWIDKEAMMDTIVIAQAAPGAIAVNVAVSVGYRFARLPGALAALLGTVLPPLVILTAVQGCYAAFIHNAAVAAAFRGMNAAMAAVMVSVLFDMGRQILTGRRRMASFALMALVFILVFWVKVNATVVMAAAILLGLTAGLTAKKKPQMSKG